MGTSTGEELFGLILLRSLDLSVRMGGEKKFTLTPEKKKKLRVIIMKRAQDDLKREEELKQKAKDDFLSQKVAPLNIDGLNATALKDTCVKLYQKVWEVMIYSVDFEYRLVKQDSDINELTVQLNDIKGKFMKPQLKKVSKVGSRFTKMAAKKEEPAFSITALKATEKKEFKLEEGKERVDFRKELKHGEEE